MQCSKYTKCANVLAFVCVNWNRFSSTTKHVTLSETELSHVFQCLKADLPPERAMAHAAPLIGYLITAYYRLLITRVNTRFFSFN
jgi:hypothetical protein